jgi:hypothetical protein
MTPKRWTVVDHYQPVPSSCFFPGMGPSTFVLERAGFDFASEIQRMSQESSSQRGAAEVCSSSWTSKLLVSGSQRSTLEWPWYGNSTASLTASPLELSLAPCLDAMIVVLPWKPPVELECQLSKYARKMPFALTSWAASS